MTDAEKIERIKTMVSEWAIDDKQGGGDAMHVLSEIMNLLDFDPWDQVPATTVGAGGGG
jgi:hypothetical protein